MQGIAKLSNHQSKRFLTLSILVSFLFFSHTSWSAPYQQDSSADNLLVFEAEHFATNTAQGLHSWSIERPKGYAGSGAVKALPNTNTDIQVDYVTGSPSLSYSVNFAQTGTHYVWVRARSETADDNALHVGLNGQAVPASSNISGFTSAWSWVNLQGDVTPAMMEIVTPGTNEINIWMAEDGIEVDKILITTNPSYVPSGIGPVESLNGVAFAPGNIGGSIATDTVLLANEIYTVTSLLSVSSSAQLTIQEGATLKFNNGTGIKVDGKLRVLGSEVADVVFTSSNAIPAIGDWSGIQLYDGSHSVIEKANIQYGSSGVRANHSSKSQIHNSLITNNSIGVSTRGYFRIESYNPEVVITENSIYGNTNYNVETYNYGNGANTFLDANNNWWGTTDINTIHAKIFDHGDNARCPWVETSTIWADSNGTVHNAAYIRGNISTNITLSSPVPYELSSNLIVDSGATLTIAPGTTFKATGSNLEITVNGTIQVLGTAESPVTFTHSSQTKGSWAGINIKSNDLNNLIDYAVVEYATNGIKFYNSTGTVQNSTIRNNNTGIYVGINSNPLITGSMITANTTGIFAYGNGVETSNPNPVVNQNRIFDNTGTNFTAYLYGNAVNTILNANNNWWGTTVFTAIHALILDHQEHALRPWIDTATIWADETGTPHTSSLFRIPVSQNTTLSAGLPYELIGDVTVNAGVTLTMNPGTIVQSDVVGAELLVDGVLRALGTELEPVLFTNPNQTIAGWEGIFIRSNDPNNLIEHATIEYANIGVRFENSSGVVRNGLLQNNSIGIKAGISSTPLIANSVFKDNNLGMQALGNYDVAVNPAPTVAGNSFYSNNNHYSATNFGNPESASLDAKGNWWGTTDFSAIEDKIGDRYDNAAWPWIDVTTILASEGGAEHPVKMLPPTITSNTSLAIDSEYYMYREVTVNLGVTFTIPSGVTISAEKGAAQLFVDGVINVQGTQASPVRFTSNEAIPNKSDWKGITIRSNDATNLIDYAIVEYAESGIRFENSTGVVSNSLIQNNTYGVYMYWQSTPSILNNTIVNNTYGIYLEGGYDDVYNPQPTINGNDIYSNDYYELYIKNYGAASTIIIDVTGNWWGTGTPTVGQEIYYYNSTATADTSGAKTQQQYGAGISNVSVSSLYFSPNNDAVLETTIFTGVLSASSNWTVDVVNSAGAKLRTFSGTGINISVTWGGKNTTGIVQPDGVYRLLVTATSNGHTTQPGYGTVVLDKIYPVSAISAPATSTVVQDINVLDIVGSSSDLNYLNYQLEYSNEATPDNWNQISTTSTLQVNNTLLGQWVLNSTDGSVPALPEGNYNIRLSVSDLAGNISRNTVMVTIKHISITDVSYDVKSFSPLNGELVTVTYTISEPATVTLEFLNELNSALVRSQTQVVGSAGTYTFSWDGKDDAGSYVKEDAYRFRILATSGPDKTALYEIYYEDGGTGLNNAWSINSTYNTYQNDFFSVDVYLSGYARINPSISTNTQTFPLGKHQNKALPGTVADDSLPGGYSSNWVYWDGRDPQGNIVTGVVSVYFPLPMLLQPNSVIVTGTEPEIVGTGTAPSIEVKSNPYRVIHSYDQLSNMIYRVNIDSYVTVKLLPPGINDSNDPSAIVLVDNLLLEANQADGTPIDHSFSWDGLDAVDKNNIIVSEEGAYTFAIQATSQQTGFSTLYRGVLQLYQ